MYKNRTAAKIDSNQAGIVGKLRKIPGVSVELSHDDILVGYKKKTYWFEIKNPDLVSKKTGKIIDSAIKTDQKRLLRDFTGHYEIVWSVEQILKTLGIK